MVQKTLALSLLCLTAASAADYYFSYRYLGQKNSIVEEKILLSRAMVPFRGPGRHLCTLVTDAPTLEVFLHDENDRLLECLRKEGMIVRSRALVQDAAVASETTWITLPPQPIQVDFNAGAVIVRKVKIEK